MSAPTQRSLRQELRQWLTAWRLGLDVHPDDRRLDQALRHGSRGKFWAVGIMMVLCVGWLAPATWLNTPLRWVLGAALMPMGLMLGTEHLRQVMRADELQQRIELLSMAVTFVVVAAGLLTLLCWHAVGLTVQLQPAVTWLIFLAVYVGTRRFLRYSYR
ncbi:hypothetical protein [Oleiagrimonas sp. C23AA]|uniref:hypothetical protein n=1 Tax=Oleiagrimonas sp. C23AA TaxID=2719047 RepID=UPI0014249438|nr:hypothetical protein [Oleiagrimonas sp. C23AA]NII12160.1 hypothetical protein [Oleiagrimonas sp. C23AA]